MRDSTWRERSKRVLYLPYPPILRGYDPDHSACPWFFTHGRGARIFDGDGREYLDLAMGRGPNVLGYGHPVTAEVLKQHADCGIQTSLLHRAEVEVAEMIVETVPCAEQVIFGKNGSDVCSAAVRLARAATGHDVILSCGFHGFQDWYAATMPGIEGFPHGYRDRIETFDLNDFQRLEDLADQYAGNIAGIIIEPAHRILPAPGFLEAVRDLANKHGAVLIFDEVVTAFRVNLGGAQKLFGVTPDLTCLGKAMTNGYPLSALVGRREVMRHLKSTFFSMTYQTDSLGFLLARACLSYLREQDVPDTLTITGEALRKEFDTAAEEFALPARAIGLAARLDFHFPPLNGLTTGEQERIFLDTLVEERMIPTLTAFVCEQISLDDLSMAKTAFRRAMLRIKDNSR